MECNDVDNLAGNTVSLDRSNKPSMYSRTYLFKEEGLFDTVMMDVDSQGMVFAKSQVTDYRARGPQLEEYNVIQFFSDTYELRILQNDKLLTNEDADHHDDVRILRRGRRRNDRVYYLPSHPKAKSMYRVIRTIGHNNLPNVIGRRLPSREDPDTYDFYCASILMLLKPWRQLCDLKGSSESWSDAYSRF